MEADIFELNKRLYVRWLGHEGDELGLEARETFGRYGMADLTTDWNAMGELIAVVLGDPRIGSVEMDVLKDPPCSWAAITDHELRSTGWSAQVDGEGTLPLAVCRAVDQIPEARK